MAIDGCQFTFDDLAKTELPRLFAELEESMKAPIAAKDLVGFKSCTKAALTKIGHRADFPGCYVFFDGTTPEYVGISRAVIKRLIQHLNHRSHFSASLVYRMAKAMHPHQFRREQAMLDEEFAAAFLASQKKLQEMSIAFVPISNAVEMYLFEVYASMRLDTSKWNSFRTH
jgi:hypothetical protein